MLITLRFLAVFAIFFSVVASGQNQEGPPEIVSRSPEKISIHQGEIVELAVAAAGGEIRYTWSIHGRQVCAEAKCTFTSTGWGVGVHQASVVLSNGQGSTSANFAIHILPHHADPAVVATSPEQEGVSLQQERLQHDDLYIRAARGIGFRSHEATAIAVERTASRLVWNEKIKANADATLEFGRGGMDQHFLLSSAQALLTAIDSGKRLIVLTKGAVRSRQLNHEMPNWSVIAGAWLQIDCDRDGDIIVAIDENDSDSITVIALRGTARLMQRSRNEVANYPDVVREVVVLPGTSYTANRKSNALKPILQIPESEPIAAIIGETTPEFFLPMNKATGRPRNKSSYVDSAPSPGGVTIGQAKHRAEQLIADKNLFAAIELLKPFSEQAPLDYDLSMLIGHASKGIFLYEQAADFFESAIVISPESPNPYFEIGEMLLLDGIWAEAGEFLRMADQRGFNDRSQLFYYRGVAAYHEGQHISAEQYLRSGFWAGPAPEVLASSREFLGQIRQENVVDLRFGASAFYDSNIFKLSPSEKPPQLLTVNSDHGFAIQAGLTLVFVDAGRVAWNFVYDFDHKAFATLQLSQMSYSENSIASMFVLKVGGESPNDAIYHIGLSPHGKIYMLDGKQVMDVYGANFSILFPGLWSMPSIDYETAIRRDSTLVQRDLIDPITWEAEPGSDRSSRYGGLAIKMQPYEDEMWGVDITVKSGVTAYRASDAVGESNTDASYRVGLGYRGNLRHAVGASVNYWTRNFYEAEDDRADKGLIADLDWQYFYTPNLSQRLRVSSQVADSSRTNCEFNRYNGDFGVALAF